MDATLLRTTRNADLIALGTGGQRVARCWDQITAHLTAALGPDHARLFAEPSFNAADGTIAWYAEAEGSATPIEEMAEPQQSAARERLAALVQEVQAAAARLKQGKREEERLLGDCPILFGSHKLQIGESGITQRVVAGGCRAILPGTGLMTGNARLEDGVGQMKLSHEARCYG
jgi:hypothetical protein